jgi:RNA 2',3'-cyclic 3'-phosphodiesterase
MERVYSLCATEGAERREPARPPLKPRVFIGIRIAPEIASQLAKFAAVLPSPPVRPVAPADIHLTLVPPWNEASIADAVAKLGGVATRFGAFSLVFQHVGYGPQQRRPRLLWVDCAASDEIVALRNALLERFGAVEERPFLPHVTLARIRSKGPSIAKNHPIDEPLSLAQHVESIELFQSPPPGGSGYSVLASLKLTGTAGSAPRA